MQINFFVSPNIKNAQQDLEAGERVKYRRKMIFLKAFHHFHSLHLSPIAVFPSVPVITTTTPSTIPKVGKGL